MSAVKEVTDATFEAEVLHATVPVLVDFWATWCGPCRLVAPEMEQLATKYQGVIEVRKMDVDQNPATSEALRIMSIPTIGFFRPGQPPKAVVGFRPAADLEQTLGLAAYLLPIASVAPVV
jgi:thioredoxin 1